MPCNLQLTTYSKMTLTHSVTMKRPPTNGPHSFPLFKRSKDRNSLEKRLELNFAVIVIPRSTPDSCSSVFVENNVYKMKSGKKQGYKD